MRGFTIISMQRFLYYILAFCFLLISACGAPSPSPNNPDPNNPTPPTPAPDISGTLEGSTLGVANLRASFKTSTVAQGKLEADGSFEFDFKDAIPADALNDAPACDGLTVSDASAQQNTFSALTVIIGGERKGIIALASSIDVVTDGLNNVGDFYVQYTYVDKDLSLKGDCPLSNPPAVFSYDVALKKGWNTVMFGLTQKNADGSQVLSMTMGSVPSDAAWFYRP